MVNYLDILKQIRDLLHSIDKTLKDMDQLLWEIKKNTDAYSVTKNIFQIIAI